ncbi:MAG: hypothetical protein HY708_00350 [Ignavibacteriae bacterium]|nr:hypothetical protein [Ignavibacteriota bacterium]
MASIKGRKILGLFVDGLDVKLARMSMKGKRVTVHELKSATFAKKLEERKPVDVAAGVFEEGSDAFNLPFGGATEQILEKESEDNNSVLLGLLAQYRPGKYAIAYSISEPAIYYHFLESDNGLKGRKLKERIVEELRNLRSFQPSIDAIDSLLTEDGNLLCVVREDGLTLINYLENIKGFIGNRVPTIASIDSSDIALMNMVRLNYDFEPTEVCVIVYVGVEFTRLIFIRGGEFFQFAPILSEGYDSPSLQNTVYSRLLLEQDNLAIPRISKIILAGECHRIGFKDFLLQQLPDHDVDYLLASRLDLTPLPVEQQAALSEYAVPIGAAWKVFEAANPRVYNVNLLPDSVREGQRVFKLSWHGYLLLALIFLSTLFFTLQIQDKSRELSERQDVLTLKNSQIAENTTLMNSIGALQEQIGRYQSSLALYDTLVPGADRWSRMLTQLSHGVEDLNSIWLTDMSATEAGLITMNGFTVYRTRIPRLSTLFESSLLKEVLVQEIRSQTVYKYKIEVPALSSDGNPTN